MVERGPKDPHYQAKTNIHHPGYGEKPPQRGKILRIEYGNEEPSLAVILNVNPRLLLLRYVLLDEDGEVTHFTGALGLTVWQILELEE